MYNSHTNNNFFHYITIVLVLFSIIGQPIIKAISFDNEAEIVLLEVDNENDIDKKEKKEKEESKQEKITLPIDIIKLSQFIGFSGEMSSDSSNLFTSVYLEVNIPPPEQV